MGTGERLYCLGEGQAIEHTHVGARHVPHESKPIGHPLEPRIDPPPRARLLPLHSLLLTLPLPLHYPDHPSQGSRSHCCYATAAPRPTASGGAGGLVGQSDFGAASDIVV